MWEASWKRRSSGKAKEKPTSACGTFERSQELLDLTVADPRNRKRLKELLRVREALANHFVFENHYRSTEDSWGSNFNCYLYAARGRSEKTLALLKT